MRTSKAADRVGEDEVRWGINRVEAALDRAAEDRIASGDYWEAGERVRSATLRSTNAVTFHQEVHLAAASLVGRGRP